MRALTNDIYTHYEIAGEGPPLVLVHAAGAALEMWRPQLRALAGRYKVVAYDLRGHGRSEGSEDRYDVETYARDLKALVEHLGLERFVLVGLSFGGLVAQTYASQWGEDLSALVLADTLAASALDWRAKLIKSLLPWPLLDAGLASLGAKPYTLATYWLHRKLHAPAREFASASQLAMDRGELRKLLGAAYRFRGRDLSAVTVPVLLLAGDEEREGMFAHLSELRRRMPQARVFVVPRARHLSNLENPQVFNAVLSAFLTTVPQASPKGLSPLSESV